MGLLDGLLVGLRLIGRLLISELRLVIAGYGLNLAGLVGGVVIVSCGEKFGDDFGAQADESEQEKPQFGPVKSWFFASAPGG